MQALRHASFLNTPTLLGIQTLVMMGPYLTNTGRFLDAWTLFGTTIRLAHSMGLHRNPKFLDPVPPLRECMIRRTLWWWMLHMDQQYSVTLGRPLGISGIGDCPPPEPLTTNQTVLRLGEFVNHFTIVARQILGSDGMMSVGKIDEYTDKLLGLWDTMPVTLQFNESWTRPETVLPDWPLDVMSASKCVRIFMSHHMLTLTQRCSLKCSPSSYYSTASETSVPRDPHLQHHHQHTPTHSRASTAPRIHHRVLVVGTISIIKLPSVVVLWSSTARSSFYRLSSSLRIAIKQSLYAGRLGSKPSMLL